MPCLLSQGVYLNKTCGACWLDRSVGLDFLTGVEKGLNARLVKRVWAFFLLSLDLSQLLVLATFGAGQLSFWP